MTGITDYERLDRYRYTVETLHALRNHLVSADTLAEIVSRHVYVPVTKSWIQNHWATITREVHYGHHDLWAFRPVYLWDYLVGASTDARFAKIVIHRRYREAASRMKSDIRDSNLVNLAKIDPDMADILARYQAFIDKADGIEEEYQTLLLTISELPVATAAMTRGL